MTGQPLVKIDCLPSVQSISKKRKTVKKSGIENTRMIYHSITCVCRYMHTATSRNHLNFMCWFFLNHIAASSTDRPGAAVYVRTHECVKVHVSRSKAAREDPATHFSRSLSYIYIHTYLHCVCVYICVYRLASAVCVHESTRTPAPACIRLIGPINFEIAYLYF